MSCFHRYETIEMPGLKRTTADPEKGHIRRPTRCLPWSPEEDSALIQAIDKYGAGNWCLARQALDGRTAAECFRRFQRLNPDRMADTYDILLATKRKMLPSNFDYMGPGGTHRKRSQLVASDFALRLFEAPSGGKEAEELNGRQHRKITTGDPSLDRHLRRVNSRRRAVAKELSWSQHKEITTGDPPLDQHHTV